MCFSSLLGFTDKMEVLVYHPAPAPQTTVVCLHLNQAHSVTPTLLIRQKKKSTKRGNSSLSLLPRWKRLTRPVRSPRACLISKSFLFAAAFLNLGLFIHILLPALQLHCVCFTQPFNLSVLAYFYLFKILFMCIFSYYVVFLLYILLMPYVKHSLLKYI